MDQSDSTTRLAQRRTIPLALALLAIVGGLVAIIAGMVIGESYRRGLGVATDMGLRLFENLRADIAVQQRQMVQPVEYAIAILAGDAGLGTGQAENLEESFIAVLAENPQVTEMRVAYATGELFAVGHSVGAPAEALYAVRRIAREGDGGWIETRSFIGADRTVIDRSAAAIPAPGIEALPWYAAALAAPNATVQTKAAVMAGSNAVGVSFARAFTGASPGVITADVSLARMSNILGYLKFDNEDQIFLFNDERMLLASPDVDVTAEIGGEIRQTAVAALPHPVVPVMLDRFAAGGSYASEIVTARGTAFLASIIRLGEDIEGRPNTYLAFATPAATFTGRFIDISRETAFVSFLILLAATPVIVLVARRLARPLTGLERITDAVARLDMTQGLSQGSRIREIDHLDRSIDNMRNALGQISKFVPKALLQQLIKSGSDMNVGGERRVLSMVFTDVLDFTPLAESMPAEELMTQMSDYFDALVGEILLQRGTVDKYIGDAIFAFWNAPALQPDHAALACNAALACRAASNALNARWRSEGRPIWYTRFGVHLGEAVVGNVGSRDRLDYTAIGSAINMGARLEGLNKFYATQILVSGAVQQAVGEAFLFRPIDRVLPKGAGTPMAISELLCAKGEATDEMNARCAAWSDAFALYEARDWAGARRAFEKLAVTDPDDKVAVRFRDRMAEFGDAPPSDWDGVTRFDTK